MSESNVKPASASFPQSAAAPRPAGASPEPVSGEARTQAPGAAGEPAASTGRTESDQSALLSHPPPPAAPDPYIGTTIDGRYKVESLLGEGGMGVVYKARHKVIDKAVAIKVLRADMARDSEITERFLREARAASAIGNPHIIDISDFGTLPDGSTYFVMEFLDGLPLTALLQSGEPVPMTRLIRIAEQMADGLEAAHQREIVHRDLKPDNIFVIDRGSDKDFVKILDFGIAKVSSGTAKLTRHGSVFGTPHYMSPEQAAGAPVDHRTDIYSLGVILYEMAAGRVPFDADNFMGILTQHMYQAPVPIRALVPPQDVPPGLEAIVLKCLSKKPDQRYHSMTELRGDFEKLGKGMVPDAVGEMMARSGGFNVPADFFKPAMPPTVPATPAKMMQRKPWPLYAGIAGVLAAVAIVIGIFAFGTLSTASTTTSATASATPPPPASTPPAPSTVASSPPAASAAPAVPAAKEVMVVADPLSAEISVDGRKVGTAPREVDVPVGKTVQVVLSAPGYHDEAFTLDGSEGRKDVRLRPKGGGKPAGGKPAKGETPPTPTKQPGGGTGEIVNPWGN
jgi:serine/threonine-protein kinase